MLTAVIAGLLLQMRFVSPGCAPGDGWEFVVRSRDTAQGPRWTAEADAPPLAPRAAIRAARSLLDRMSCRDAAGWEVASVALRPLGGGPDAWVYVVTLVEPVPAAKEPAGSTLRRTVEVPVLLDGTALTPSVGPWRAVPK